MKAATVTVSDGCYFKKRADDSGKLLNRILSDTGWSIIPGRVVPDDIDSIQEAVQELVSDQRPDLIVTTGGTGVGPRDLTPEALRPLLEKELAGFGELMRLRGIEKTPFASLSRSLAGTLGETLILILPGSPRGAGESLEAVLEILPHAVDLVQGRTSHTKGSQG